MIYVGEEQLFSMQHRRDRIVVSTLRCGRNNPGSNPGHGTLVIIHHSVIVITVSCEIIPCWLVLKYETELSTPISQRFQ